METQKIEKLDTLNIIEIKRIHVLLSASNDKTLIKCFNDILRLCNKSINNEQIAQVIHEETSEEEEYEGETDSEDEDYEYLTDSEDE